MYEARQNKEKASRRIDAAGGGARQRVELKKQMFNKKILQAAWNWQQTGSNGSLIFWHPKDIPPTHNYATSGWEVLHISQFPGNRNRDHVTVITGNRYNLYRDGTRGQTSQPPTRAMMTFEQIRDEALNDFDQEQQPTQIRLPIITRPNKPALKIVPSPPKP